MTAPEGPAVITLREVYDLVLSVKQELSSQNVPDMKVDVTDHEARIRALEKWVWRASGLAAVAGAGLSQIISELVK